MSCDHGSHVGSVTLWEVCIKAYGSTDISEIIMPSMRTTSIINQGGNVRHVNTTLVSRFWNYKVIEMVGLMMRIE